PHRRAPARDDGPRGAHRRRGALHVRDDRRRLRRRDRALEVPRVGLRPDLRHGRRHHRQRVRLRRHRRRHLARARRRPRGALGDRPPRGGRPLRHGVGRGRAQHPRAEGDAREHPRPRAVLARVVRDRRVVLPRRRARDRGPDPVLLLRRGGRRERLRARLPRPRSARVASRVALIFEAALLPLGIAALGVLIWRIGPEERAEILRLLALIQWWFVAIVLQEIIAHAANTAGLLACLPLDRRALGFWYAFSARLAGEGVNATMPTATVGGELLKISLLSRRAPTERVTAGISAAYASQAVAQMLFTTLALPLALPALELPRFMKGLIVL